jgi:thiamine pyrophosphokinase
MVRSDTPASKAARPAIPPAAARALDRRHGSTILVVADGDVAERAALDAAWPGWADTVGLVVAADGGAHGAARLGFEVDLLVGDADSIDPAELARLAASGVPIRRASREKDESDTELAILAAVELGAEQIVVVGAFGGRRLDHALANVGLLAHPAIGGRACVLLAAEGRVTLVTGPASRAVDGRVGDLVSLLPLGDGVAGVTTEGLAYPLRDEPLPVGPARGLSNIRAAEAAQVTVRSGRLLIVETPARLAR